MVNFILKLYKIVTAVVLRIRKIKSDGDAVIRFPLSLKVNADIKLGKHCFIEKFCCLYSYEKKGGVDIGNFFSAQQDFYITPIEQITMGERVLISSICNYT